MRVPFQCIPSVDILDGRCVRLYQGDYHRETVFYPDAIDAVRRWFDEGATLVHVVDLNGARGDGETNRRRIDGLVAAYPGRLELGGGIRTLQRAEELIGAGAHRIVFGSVAVTEPTVCLEAVRRWSEQTVLGLDARHGKVAVEGWTAQTAQSATDLAVRFADAGLRWIVYTDIERDGTLTSPNLPALQALVDASPARVIASGGVSTVAHLQSIAATGAVGAIIGRALFDGRLALADALCAVPPGE